MLYLLQTVINLDKTKENRNEYFKSIGRKDLCVYEMKENEMKEKYSTRIITNLLDWINENEIENNFDGNLLFQRDEFIVTLSRFGRVEYSLASQIHEHLINEINVDSWLESHLWSKRSSGILKLETYGCNELYLYEKKWGDCTNDDIIDLLTYVNPDPQSWKPENSNQKTKKKPILRGVFQSFKWSNNFKNSEKKPKPSALEMDVLLNGIQDAITTTESDHFDTDEGTKRRYESRIKEIHRWERLIVDFFKGKKRKWEFDDGKYDIPHPDQQKCDKWQKILDGTSPQELLDKGELKQDVYGTAYDGKKFKEANSKELIQQIMDYLIPGEIRNLKKKPFNTRIRGSVCQIVRGLNQC